LEAPWNDDDRLSYLVLPDQLPDYHPGGIDLDVPLFGATRLEILVDRSHPGPGAAWVHVADARLEAPE
jgi:hypothetical protein